MDFSINKEQVADRAGHYFEHGFHCAEAIASSFLESIDQDPTQAVRHATAFGGGFGRSFQEICGAVSGAAIICGHLFGRRDPDENWDVPADCAAQLRAGFIECYGTTHCKTLRDRFGAQQPARCCELVKETARSLVDVVVKQQAVTELSKN